MPTRDRAPNGSPCWADLWTSDVEGSRTFYSELLGWEAQEPSPEFGGYFMFTANGIPMAGGMGDMGDMKADNRWKVYLTTDDIEKTAAATTAAGGQIVFPPMAVADLGSQAVLIDPTGAAIGAWQPGTFPGFTLLNEPGAPCWFELHTADHGAAVAFYRAVFHWDTNEISDTDDFRYTTMRDPNGGEDVAGIFDAAKDLAPGQGAYWAIYWEVADIDASVAKTTSLGGSIVQPPLDTPHGRIATVNDPAGAEFKLRTKPA